MKIIPSIQFSSVFTDRFIKGVSVLKTKFRLTISLLIIFTMTVHAFTAELAGGLSGSFQQSPGGQATYNIEIQTPPGRVGVSPNISLSYSSSGSNGLLGMGWQLSAGLGRIDRVGQTFDLDGKRVGVSLPADGGFALDRLALNGNRLMLVSGSYGADGSTYQTRQQTQQLIEAIDQNANLPGPEMFEVKTALGLVMRFGEYAHHRIQVSPDAPVISWLLSSVEDVHGNQMTFDYYRCPDANFCAPGSALEYLPKAIFYEGRMVTFDYETRPDQTRYFNAGLEMGQTQRLREVRMYVNQDGDSNYTEAEDFAYRYAFTYLDELGPRFNAASKLAQVQQFDKDGNSLAPVTFEWLGGNDQLGFFDYTPYRNHSSPLPLFSNVKTWANQPYNGKYNEGTHMVDLNGDGLKDLVQGVYWSEPSGGTPTVTRRILLNSRTGWQELAADHPYMSTWAALGSSALFVARSQVNGNHPGGDLGTRFADLNGDGLPDMIQLVDGREAGDENLSKPNTTPQVLINRGEANGWSVLPASHPLLSVLPKFSNGDSQVFFSKLKRQQVYHQGSTFGGTQLVDLDGDSRPDLFQWIRERGGHRYRIYLNRGTDPQQGGWQVASHFQTSVQALLGDNRWSTHSGFAEDLFANGNFSSWRSDLGMRLNDVNGDGLPDLVLYNEGRDSYPTLAAVALNRGHLQGFIYDAAFSNSLPVDANAPFFTRCIPDGNQVKQRGTRFADLNGDGLPDLLRLYKDASGNLQKRLLFNTGKTFVEANNWTMPGDDAFFTYFDNYNRDGGVRLADINNDRLMDLIVLFYDAAGNHRRQIYLQEINETRRGWFAAPQSSSARDWFSGIPSDLFFTGKDGNSSFDMGTRIDDVNGDQRLDLIQLVHVDQVYSQQHFLLGQYAALQSVEGTAITQTATQRIRRITEGLGGIMEFEYNPLSLGGDLYQPGTGASYPYRDLTPARQVLSTSYAHQSIGWDATAQTLVTNYRYQGYRAMADEPTANGQPGFDGSGSLGFKSVEAIAVNQGVSTKTTFEQDQYLVNGRAIHVINCTADATPDIYGEVFLDYEVRTDFPNSQGQTYQIHRNGVTQHLYEDGQLVYRIRDEKAFDAYGNVVLERRLGDLATAEDDVFIHRTFNNRIDTWHLGYKELETFSSSANPQNLSARVHVTDFDYTSNWLLKASKVLNLSGGASADTTFTYDDYGNIASKTDATGTVTAFEYDTTFNMFMTAIIKDPLGLNHRTEMLSDPIFGNQLEVRSLNGNRVKTTYDGFGRQRHVYMEELDSAVLKIVKSTNYYWATSDQRGMRVKEIQAADWDTPLHLDYFGTNTWKDTWGRTYRIRQQNSRDGMMSNVFTRFNDEGRIGKVSLPTTGLAAHWVNYTYDERGRQVEIAYPAANANDPVEVERYDYSFANIDGRAHTMMVHYGRHLRGGPAGKVTKTLSDARQRIKERRFVMDDGSESRMFYEYDAMDRVVAAYSQENAHGERVRFRANFDSQNRKLSSKEEVVRANGANGWDLLESKTYTYEHDLAGRVTAILDPNGNRTEAVYDHLGRKTLEKLLPADPISDGELAFVRFTHDVGGAFAIGNVSQIRGQDLTGQTLFQYDFTYDKYGKITNQVTTFNPGGSWEQSFSYRPDGKPVDDVLPDGSILRRTYTGLGWPESLTLDEPGFPERVHAEWHDYNAAGSPGRLVYGNGVVTEYTHEAHSMRLASAATFDSNDALIADKSYFWDENGQIAQILDDVYQDQDQSFTYDRLNRLVYAQGVYGSRAYSYDAAGNMLEKGDKLFEDFTGFRLDSGFDAASGRSLHYSYDANGNQVARNVSGTDEFFEYDPYNRLVNYFRQEANGQVFANMYRYDHLGRRYMKQDSDGGVTYYVSPGFEVFAKGNLEQVTKYVHGSGGKLAQVTTVMGPDLTVAIRGTEVLDYNRYRLELKVRNIGDRVTQNNCLLVLRTDLDYAERTVNPLPPGGHQRFFIEVDASALADVMTVVDADFDVEEKDENNNLYQYQIPIGPDLTFGDVEVVALSATQARLTAVVRNAGKGPSIATDILVTGPGFSAEGEIEALAAGAEQSFAWTINLPGGVDARPTFELNLDTRNRVTEMVETNNSRKQTLYVPDYTVSNLRMIYSKKSGIVTYEVQVTNLGQGGPDQVTLELVNRDTGARQEQTVQLGKPGSATWALGSISGTLAHKYRATVNPDRAIYESNNNNNQVDSNSIIGEESSAKMED